MAYSATPQWANEIAAQGLRHAKEDHPMLARRFFPLLFVLIASMASARIGEPFDQRTFDRLNAGGKPILVAFHADWCTICKAQEKALAGLMQRPAFKDLAVLRIDFDSQKDTFKAFQVTERSTLIVFCGGKEVGRLTGETGTPAIEGLLQKAF
jgi:thiol-disulfide isomerase/thioredoxin